MKVLIIGGTGNISRGIVASLLQRNHEVVMFNRGQHPDAPPPDIQVIHGDRQDRDAFENRMRAEKFDAVIDMISYNADDAASALRAFRGRVDGFIHCSTVMTYGPPFPFSGVNIPETAPLNGTSEYGRGKIAADQLLLDAHAEDGFPVTIFKPSYTHGPGMQVHRQVGGDGSWIDRLRKGKPILSAGDGLNYFQFLSSRDAGVGFAAGTRTVRMFRSGLQHRPPGGTDMGRMAPHRRPSVRRRSRNRPCPPRDASRHCTRTVPRVKRKLRSYADLYRCKTRKRHPRISAGDTSCGERCRKHRLDG